MDANSIEPKKKEYELILHVMKARNARKGNETKFNDKSEIKALTGLMSNPLILNRAVEAELISCLYEMNSIQLDKTKRVGLLASGKNDARFGNGAVSRDFSLFEDRRPVIQKLAKNLTEIITGVLNSDIYIDDSFFTDAPSIVNFIFTRCQDVCPALSQKMQYIQDQIPQAKLVSISVDPEYDTPSVLKEYSARFQAGSSWFFLTGSREQITKTNAVFQQAYKEERSADDAPNILHSQKFILVDDLGFIRGFYDDNSTDLKRLIKDYHRIKSFF